MKSKRRHELQTNQLADQLGHWIERVRPYTTVTLVLAAGAILVLAAWYYLAAGHEKKRAESWRSYMLAGTNPQGDIVEELNLVADQFDDTQAGLWAALTAADVESARGMRLMFTDRAAAETSLNLAKSRYREVLDNKRSAQDTLLSSRTHYGLAQAHEAQSELDEAKKQYAMVAEGSSGNALGKAAQNRLNRLDMATTKKWYNWFANQKPAPRNLGTGPAASNPLGAPGPDLSVLPEGPSTDFLKDETPAAPKSDAPTPPASTETGTGAATNPDASDAPKDAPIEPTKDAPVEPTKDAPVEPTKDAPVEPTKDAPVEPAKDMPPLDAPGK
jgi:hypothetical protein